MRCEIFIRVPREVPASHDAHANHIAHISRSFPTEMNNMRPDDTFTDTAVRGVSARRQYSCTIKKTT